MARRRGFLSGKLEGPSPPPKGETTTPQADASGTATKLIATEAANAATQIDQFLVGRTIAV